VFIVLEGIDGCGKDSQADLLAEQLIEQGEPVKRFQDPGSTPLGEQLRPLLKSAELPMTPFTQMLLFTAARHELGQKLVVRPPRTWVIMTRWVLSTLVYQGHLQNVPLSLIQDLYKRHNASGPDLTVLLDITPKEACFRREDRAEQVGDRFESRGVAYFAGLRAAYLQALDSASMDEVGETAVVDAEQPPEVVNQDIWRAIRAAQTYV